MRSATWLIVSALLAGCEGWQAYAKPEIVDVDPMGRVQSYESGGGWRSEPVDDGKAVEDMRAFEEAMR